VEALNKPVVVLAGFGTSTAAWKEVYERQREMIKDLQHLFPNAMDESKNVTHTVNYVVRRIIGFDNDDDLYRFSAAIAFESSLLPGRIQEEGLEREDIRTLMNLLFVIELAIELSNINKIELYYLHFV